MEIVTAREVADSVALSGGKGQRINALDRMSDGYMAIRY